MSEFMDEDFTWAETTMYSLEIKNDLNDFHSKIIQVKYSSVWVFLRLIHWFSLFLSDSIGDH